MEEDTNMLETLLKSFLISTTAVMNANTLEREFRENENRSFPFRKLGFSSFVDYLRSIPHVVKLMPNYGPNPDVHPVLSSASKHVNDLVVKSRKSKPRSAKGGGSLRRKDSVRRRPTTVLTGSYSRSSSMNSYARPAPVSSFSRSTSASFNSYSNSASISTNFYSKPASISTNSYSRPASYPTNSYSSPKSVFSDSFSKPAPVSTAPGSRQPPSNSPSPETEDPRELLYELVSKVAQHPEGIRVQDLEHNLTRSYLKLSNREFTDLLHQALTRNMIDREGHYLYSKLDGLVLKKVCFANFQGLLTYGLIAWGAHSSNSSIKQHNNNNYDKSESNGYDEYTEDDYWDEYDEELEKMPEEALSKMTIEHFTQEPCKEFHQSAERSYATNGNPERRSSPSSIGGSDDDEYIFSDKMIDNFRTILEKNPEGFWLSELAGKYYDEFKVPLDYIDLGFPSAILMVELLPEVFYVKRENSFGDWKLLDARENRDLPPQLHVKTRSSGQVNLGNYIPHSILENIKKLAEYHFDGFRSTELQHLYETHFKKSLDWKTMGFKQIDDFINGLGNIVSVQKAKDYYLILPKHHIRPYPSNKEHVPALTLEKASFLRSVPENVLKSPEDIIPNQELPPSNQKKICSDPLLELEIRISEVINPHNFYFILCSEYNNLQIMMDDLDKFYKHEGEHFYIPPALVASGLFVACLFEGYWHRAKVKDYYEDNLVEIEYIDYGTVVKVQASELRFLLEDFATLPVQAFHGKLLNIYPPKRTTKWPRESSLKFLELVNNKRLFGQIYDTLEDQEVHLMIIYDTENPQKEIIINDTLAEEGFAMSYEEFMKYKPSQDCHSTNKSLKEEEESTEPLPNQDYSFSQTSSVNASKLISKKPSSVPIKSNTSTSDEPQKRDNSSSTIVNNHIITNGHSEPTVPTPNNPGCSDSCDLDTLLQKKKRSSFKKHFC